jgi:hypothetical protein
MAGAGSVVLVTALLCFVLIPRQVDRTLSAALRAAPPLRDTVALLGAREKALRTRDALLAVRRRTAAPSDSNPYRNADSSAALVVDTSAGPVSLLPPDLSEFLELRRQVAQARQAPLVERYRALVDTRALRNDRAARIALDSIERVHAEREAHAALGGPDARYAALTEELTRLGTQLVQRADAVLATRAQPSGIVDSAAMTATGLADSVQAAADSAAARALLAAEATVAAADSVVAAARAHNARERQARDALRTRLQVAIPPQAMLVASLILAIAGGFGASLWRELRQPTVGDAEELEGVTRARVLVHRADPGRRGNTGVAGGRATPTSDDETWGLLHVLLTRLGDVARQVQVAADQPALAEVIALRLATTAARASRVTVLVDAVAGRLSVGVGPSGFRPAAASMSAASGDTPWHPPRVLRIDQDVSLDVIRPRERLRGRGAPDQAASAALAPQLQPYDLAVLVADAPAAPMLPASADLVLCARRGVTPLAWVAQAMRDADAEGRVVRAVVLWAGELPLVG